MLVLAHRGYHAEFVENTMAAFQAAAKLGVDGIETDVRLSRDGVPILFHDRVAADGRPVAEHSHEELVRSWSIPTLEQALLGWPELFWNVEIKTPAALLPSLELLNRHPRKDRVLLTSFRHELVVCAAATGFLACGLLLAERPVRLAPFLDACVPYPGLRTLVWDYDVLDESLASEAGERGFRNFVYGPVTRDEHVHCAHLKLAALITDFPRFIINPAKP